MNRIWFLRLIKVAKTLVKEWVDFVVNLDNLHIETNSRFYPGKKWKSKYFKFLPDFVTKLLSLINWLHNRMTHSF